MNSRTPHTETICLACGTELEPCLAHTASLRCHDCRATRAPLRADLVEPATPRRPHLVLIRGGLLDQPAEPIAA